MSRKKSNVSKLQNRKKPTLKFEPELFTNKFDRQQDAIENLKIALLDGKVNAIAQMNDEYKSVPSYEWEDLVVCNSLNYYYLRRKESPNKTESWKNPQFIANEIVSYWSGDIVKSKGGRPQCGDDIHLKKMNELLVSRQCSNVSEAAREVINSGDVEGTSFQQKVDRLRRKYKKRYG